MELIPMSDLTLRTIDAYKDTILLELLSVCPNELKSSAVTLVCCWKELLQTTQH